jgi:lipopolysaccharide assembly protein A
MRFLSFLFLLAFAGAVALFAWQNQQELTLTFLDWTVDAPMSLIIGAAFVLGMLSGWSLLRLVRRSVHRTAEMFDRRRERVAV